MSKKQVKNALKDLDRDQLQELILEVYSKVKEAKEFLDFYAEPNEEDKVNQIKEKMYLEFFPLRRRMGKCRFSPCKRLISKFEKMGGSPQLILDLMLFLLELGHNAIIEYGMNIESFHVSMANNLKATLNYARRHMLQEEFKDRLLQQCKDATRWSFYDICRVEIYEVCDELGVDVP